MTKTEANQIADLAIGRLMRILSGELACAEAEYEKLKALIMEATAVAA